jgi:cysteine synthase A
MTAFRDNLESIGRTPLVRINRLSPGSSAKVYAKIEGRNPAYSVKCRMGKQSAHRPAAESRSPRDT